MVMSHMAFVNCTARATLVHISNCILGDKGITMTDIEFRSNANVSGITVASACHLEVKRALFSNNSGNSSIIQLSNGAQSTISNSLFKGNEGPGAILAQDSVLIIQHCNFTSNNSKNQAAILMQVSNILYLGDLVNRCEIINSVYGWSKIMELPEIYGN